ncbi:MAG: DUF1064 domain-containing protein, partial [Paracoccus sp. (in: a-proteobacteria)]
YKNKKTEVSGVIFDSRKEAKRYQELKWLEKIGDIEDLELQPKFIFKLPDGTPIKNHIKGSKTLTYIADFKYKNSENKIIVEDVKGFITPVYRIKETLMWVLYGIKIERV